MILRDRIPREFYRLFSTKYMDSYMVFLTAIRKESSRSYSSLGLTEQECRAVISEKLAELRIDWVEEDEEESEEGTRQPAPPVPAGLQGSHAYRILSRLIRWGWLRSDYDDKLNCNVLSFPEYSQLYAELFEKLLSEDDGKERESILAVYSCLFTYQADQEKNNDILKSALKTSQNLGQLLSNMQDGMGAYFDELSRQREFRGIQEVLVKELNNSYSRKYAILTTTDSFYRYKEAVKELIDQILREKERKREALLRAQDSWAEGTLPFRRGRREIEQCGEAIETVCQIEREFDAIERKYNRLIEQKTIFAGRAAARIRYILQEGDGEEDQTIALVNLLARSGKREEILEEFTGKMGCTSLYKVVTDSSFYARRDREPGEFCPQAVRAEESGGERRMEDFVLKPLYTKRQLRSFVERHTENGIFTASGDTVRSVEDLEKLLFVWQDAVGSIAGEAAGKASGRAAGSGAAPGGVRLEGEITTEDGFTFSGLVIGEEEIG